MDQRLFDLMEVNPVIAAIKDDNGLSLCCQNEDIKVVFILYGDICSIRDIVSRVKASGKIVFVHMDLIAGLNGADVAVDFIRKTTEADGIISTKPSMIKKAREMHLYTILRIFILDSMAFKNIEHQASMGRPDMIEILPGLMPKIIRKVSRMVKIPVIAGGLITEKEDIVDALSAGAISVSSTNSGVWNM